jgi:ABC-2 type transport system permease protein
MRAFSSQLRLNLVLAVRNRMGLIYGFLFPLIFLGAFWALYRHDEVPLALHMGELITITILGGACFGLPTTLVSERERGVWRRYQATPRPAGLFIAANLVSRLILIAAAVCIQLAVAVAVGMPAPTDPLGLAVAFVCTCAAFLGVGLVIAMLADNVPAVQALGQCIFLPMLIVGGVAVRLTVLPEWAQHVSAFMPGRYAVAAIQRSVTGDGQAGGAFELLALLLMGTAGFIAGLRLFRWAPAQPAPRGAPIGVAVALGMWLVVGVAAEVQGRVAAEPAVLENVAKVEDFVRPSPPAPLEPRPVQAPPPAEAEAARAQPPAAEPPAPKAAPSPEPAARPKPSDWRQVSEADYKRVAFERLPDDTGVISPFASTDEVAATEVADTVDRASERLASWAPAQVEDPVQRVRNYLYVAAVADLLQMTDVERFLPLVIMARLRQQHSDEELKKLLYWVAMHPDEGDDSAVARLEPLGLPRATGPARAARPRVMIYAFKMLGRLTGDLSYR